jgi:tetratricopeptide (TPR) repeat protein
MARTSVWEREAVERGIRGLLDRLRQGAGGALFIVGDAGLGKTTMLEFARTQAVPDVPVGDGNGNAMESSVPFGLLTDALWSLAGQDVVRMASRRNWAGDTRAALFYEVLRWLRHPGRGPLLFALDDVHWADADSLAMLSFLCRRIGSSPVGLIATLRPWPPAAQHVVAALAQDGYATVRRLAPLSAAAARALLASRLGHFLDDRMAEHAWRIAAGNPLLLEQFAAAFACGEVVSALAGGSSAAVSEGLLLTRFAGLPASGMRYVRAACVLGTRFRPSVAMTMAELSDAELAEAVDSLYRSGLLIDGPPGWSQFVHPLFAQALYADLTLPMRSLMHRRAFDTLARQGRDSEAAEHAMRADLSGHAEAIRVLHRTGTAALRAGGLATAARHLEAAVRLAGDGAEAQLLLALGEVLLAAGRPAKAIPVYQRALASGNLALKQRVDALRMLARAHFADGDHHIARTYAQRAVELAETDLPAAAVDVLLDGAVAARVTVGPMRSLRLVRRAHDLSRSLSSRTRHRVDIMHHWFALLCGEEESPDRLHSHSSPLGTDPAADLVEEDWASGLIDAYCNITMLTERFPDTRKVLLPSLAAAENAGAVEAVGALSLRAAVLLHRTGPLDQALMHACRAVEVAELVPVVASFADMTHALILLHMGRVEESIRWCAKAEATAADRGERLVQLWAWHLRAQHSFHRGHMAEARKLYERIEELSHDMGIGEPCAGLWARHAIAAYLAGQRTTAATRLITWLEDYGQRSSCRWPRIAAATGRAWLAERDGDLACATEWFRAALKLHETVELPMEQAETLVAFGAFLRRHGQRAEARAPLAEALRIAEHQHAGLIAGQAREELAIAGGRRRRVSPGSSQLTAQEERVARLAAEAQTNKQIAGALSLSVKTVEYHLQQIYLKLGMHSRRELMAHYHTAGTRRDPERPPINREAGLSADQGLRFLRGRLARLERHQNPSCLSGQGQHLIGHGHTRCADVAPARCPDRHRGERNRRLFAHTKGLRHHDGDFAAAGTGVRLQHHGQQRAQCGCRQADVAAGEGNRPLRSLVGELSAVLLVRHDRPGPGRRIGDGNAASGEDKIVGAQIAGHTKLAFCRHVMLLS